MPDAKSATPKLYLNHDVHKAAAEALRREGHEVVAAIEVGMERASDEEHMVYAARECRTLVSFNVRDYQRVHAKRLATGKEHWGIVVSPHVPIRSTIRGLRQLVTNVLAADLRNQLRWL